MISKSGVCINQILFIYFYLHQFKPTKSKIAYIGYLYFRFFFYSVYTFFSMYYIGIVISNENYS